jgi:hypothetical protein
MHVEAVVGEVLPSTIYGLQQIVAKELQVRDCLCRVCRVRVCMRGCVPHVRAVTWWTLLPRSP